VAAGAREFDRSQQREKERSQHERERIYITADTGANATPPDVESEPFRSRARCAQQSNEERDTAGGRDRLRGTGFAPTGKSDDNRAKSFMVRSQPKRACSGK